MNESEIKRWLRKEDWLSYKDSLRFRQRQRATESRDRSIKGLLARKRYGERNNAVMYALESLARCKRLLNAVDMYLDTDGFIHLEKEERSAIKAELEGLPNKEENGGTLREP